MYVCMHVCMYVFVCMYCSRLLQVPHQLPGTKYVYMYICIYMYDVCVINTHTPVCMYVCNNIHTHAHTG